MDVDSDTTYKARPLCRRIYARYIVDATGDVATEAGPRRPVIVKDVSVRGAGVIGNLPLAVDKKITIDIHSSVLQGGPIHKRAQVRWSQQLDKNLWMSGLDFGLDNIVRFFT